MAGYHNFALCVIKVILFSGAVALAAPAEKVNGKNQKPVTPAPAVSPVPKPNMISPMSSVPVYPRARRERVPSINSKDNRHLHLATYLSGDDFMKILNFYQERCERLPPMKPVKEGDFTVAQGWVKNLRRGKFHYRVFLSNPAFDPGLNDLNPKLTKIEYFMERR